jgi:hypothetical protein
VNTFLSRAFVGTDLARGYNIILTTGRMDANSGIGSAYFFK